MSRDEATAMLGRAGETIVSNFFVKKMFTVEASVDQYDSTKDMLINNKKVEVKTQVPFVFKHAFSFKKTQLRKCLNSDFVVFVSVPNNEREHFSSGKGYLIQSKLMRYTEYTTKDGRDMILIPIKQKDMNEIFTMTEEECKILKRYSQSDWNK